MMHIEGDEIPEVGLQFQDHTGMLPMGVFNAASNSINKSKHQAHLLSTFLQKNGPGVYYILSCRPYPYGTKETIQKNITAALTARERQRGYSDTQKFEKMNELLTPDFLKTIGNYGNHAGKKLSGYDKTCHYLNALLLAITYLGASSSTAIFVKGTTFQELAVLLGHAYGGPLSMRIYATKKVLGLAWQLGMNFFSGSYRQRVKDKTAVLEKKLSAARVWWRKSKEKELEGLRLMQTFGFDSDDPAEINRRYKLQRQQAYLQGKNGKVLEQLDKAYAIAKGYTRRQSVFTRWLRQRIITPNRQNNTNSRLPENSTRAAKDLMHRWGFKAGQSSARIAQVYDAALRQYSMFNRVRGIVPASLAQARNIALHYGK